MFFHYFRCWHFFICVFGTLCLLEGGDDETDRQDPFSQLDDDDQLSDGETVLGADIPEGFRLHMSPPPALDQSLVKREVIVRS